MTAGWVWKILGGVVLLAALVVGGSRLYDYAMQARLSAVAAEAEGRGDVRAAVLAYQGMLLREPDQKEALRGMARLAEESGSPLALYWWRRLASVEGPGSPFWLEVARLSLATGDSEGAQQALAGAAQALGGTRNYERLAGALAVARRRPDEARRHFEAAVRSGKAEPVDELNVATVDLASADPVRQEAGGRRLREFLESGPADLRPLAGRALLADAIRRGAGGESLAFAEKLRLSGEPRDEILWLETVRRFRPESFADELARAQTDARSDAGAAYALMAWLNDSGEAAQAWEWAGELLPEVRSALPVEIAACQSLANLGRWEELSAQLATRNWAELEFLRLAWQARAKRGMRGDPAIVQAFWAQALAAAKRPASLELLASLAGQWGWAEEAADAWWSVARGPDHEERALQALYRIYRKTDNTTGLLRVFKRAAQRDPEDLVAVNNYAALRLLLGHDVAGAAADAAAAHARRPKDAGIAATHAMALHRQGRSAEGLAVLRGFSPAELESPAVAATYGILLAEAGEKEAAARFLEIALGGRLLSEERAMAEAAQRKIQP